MPQLIMHVNMFLMLLPRVIDNRRYAISREARRWEEILLNVNKLAQAAPMQTSALFAHNGDGSALPREANLGRIWRAASPSLGNVAS
jgi:hypothetical protein